jgi:hypothetical protein
MVLGDPESASRADRDDSSFGDIMGGVAEVAIRKVMSFFNDNQCCESPLIPRHNHLIFMSS